MKNKIKSFLALFLILPCIFMFAGCFNNNNSISLDVSGEYTPVEATQFNDYTKENSKELGNNFKMKSIFKTDYSSFADPTSPNYDPDFAGMNPNDLKSTVEVNAHYSLDDTGAISTCSLYMPLEIENMKINIKVYIQDGMIYMDMQNVGKVCMSLEDLMASDDPSTSQFADTSFIEDYENFLSDENISKATLGYNVKITNEGQENESKTEKYKIELSQESLDGTAYSEYVAYLVYENNSLHGVYLTYGAEFVSYEVTIIMVDEAPTLPTDLDTYFLISDSDTGSL